MTPDFVWDMSQFEGWPEEPMYHGPEGTRAFLRAWTEPWEDWQLQLESVHGKIGFHPELMRDLGISAQPSVGADSYYRIVTPFEATSCPIWRARIDVCLRMVSPSMLCPKHSSTMTPPQPGATMTG